ncbi:MAG: hypothetical protein K6D97_07760 [Clostridia bacterium]|nr:hypothetical protein [Clostridia bacterium]
MEIKSEVLHNLIDSEVENIDFLLDLINSNKDLSLSLINTFISTIEFHSTSEDLEFFNKMLLELQVSINDNSRIESELEEIKALFEKMTSRLGKGTLITALEAIKEKQAEVHQTELKLFSFTPKLLNKVNQNILNIKHKDLRDEIKRVMPKNVTDIEEVPSTSAESVVKEAVSNIADSASQNVVAENIKENSQEVDNDNTKGTIPNEVQISGENTTTNEVLAIENSTPVEDVPQEDDSTSTKDMSQIEEKIKSEIMAESNINSEFSIPEPDEITAPIEVIDDEKLDEEKQQTAEVVTVSVPKPEQNENQDTPYEIDSLIISEITGEVILPFTHTVVDINEFKNPMSARFREGYRLSREREHEGILMSISIGLKLCFKSNIHPAIIRACRDFEDLDTFLFYLGNNQAEFYPNFKILYKSYPMKNYF